MVLNNKILRTFNTLNEGYNQVESIRKISSTVQSTNPSKKRRVFKSRNNFTLSEYLNKIITVPQSTEHRTGFAQVLDSKINNLKTRPDINSFSGYSNFLQLEKNSTVTCSCCSARAATDAISGYTLAPHSINEAKYSNLVLSQLSELSQIAKFLGVSTIFNSKEKIEYNIRHYLNLLTKFEYKLSNSYYDYFHFNKSNNNKYLFAMEKATNLLKLVFLSKGCLISKPIFNVVYSSNLIEGEITNSEHASTFPVTGTKANDKPKIIISLFYFVNYSLSNAKSSLGSQSKRRSMKQSMLNGVESLKDGQITTIYNDKFLFLSEILNKLFNCDVELNLVRLYLPYQDSNILAQYLNIGSFKKRFVYLASRLFRTVKIFKKTMIANRGIKTTFPNGKSLPACILNGPFAPLSGDDTGTTLFPLGDKIAYPSGVSGVNIKLAGRTPTQKLIPRVAVRRAQRGNFSRLNSKMIEKSMCIDTSKKGSFNFTVKLSHVFR